MEDGGRASSDEMDDKRQIEMAYHYLCHLEEARLWLSSCIEEELPAATQLEESLRNGVYLARLSHFFAPGEVPLKRIYDIDQTIYSGRGLCFRHTDNINRWLNAMRAIGLPEYFFPDAFDLYEKKNLPKVIYCLHALSLYLFRLGKAPKIEDLLGKLNFSDDEVDQVRRGLGLNAELQMPAFCQIGGILAKEMSADAAAVVAINTAIDRQELDLLLEALSAPSAQLREVHSENVSRYQAVLEKAKRMKSDNMEIRSLEYAYVPDMYDRLLSLAEVQGYILETNVNVLLTLIDEVIEAEDLDRFRALVLSRPDLGIQDVVADNVPAYFQVLLKIRDDAYSNNNVFSLLRSDLQIAIHLANEKVEEETRVEEAVEAINVCLDCDEANNTLEALRDPGANLPLVYPLAALLYHSEFSFIRKEAGHNLCHEELVGGVRILNAIAEINFALKSNGTFNLVECLENPNAHIADVRPQNHDRYAAALAAALVEKTKLSPAVVFLTHIDIQDIVSIVNAKVDNELSHEQALELINEAIMSRSANLVLEALLNPAATILHVSRDHVLLYQDLLFLKLQSLEERPLTEDDVQGVVDTANQVAVEASNMCIGLATLNVGVCNQVVEDVRSGLESLKIVELRTDATESYLKELQRIFSRKFGDGSSIEWFSYLVRPRLFFNLNVVQFRSEWASAPKADCNSFLSLEDIQRGVARVNEQLKELQDVSAIEPMIIKLQARMRGCLIRSAVREQYVFYCEHIGSIIKIQAWYRSMRERVRYKKMLYELDALVPFVTRLQSYVRRYLVHQKINDLINHYKDNEHIATVVQTHYRSSCALRDYRLLTRATPSFPVLVKFLHMLSVSEHDLAEEMEVQRVKERVVATIRHNQSLEKEVDQMDIRIGLLVRNCITLEDVMSHSKREAVKSDWLGSSGGLTALSHQSREKLVAYQHLFYLLQVEPSYLAQLIFVMAPHNTNNFVETVIYSVYNYGSTPREEYLLLRLFRLALQEEVRSSLSHPSDILKGNPMVIKMAVGFYRTKRGQSCLEQLLAPLVKDILSDQDLDINFYPVDIYKQWVNQVETASGKTCGLSYEVTEEQALQQSEVCRRLHESVLQLEAKALMFAKSIADSEDKVPYGMRYICKVLKQALEETFPDAAPNEVLKAIGNLLYYRYINPGIVAPESFGIVELERYGQMTHRQRRNLGSISRVLMFASSGMPYGHQHSYQIRLNKLTASCGDILHRFFLEACDVAEPEAYFNIDTYSEATQLTPPTISLTAVELRDTHKLLLEFRSDIAPDPKDPLHVLLQDLGPEPTIEDLLGPANDSPDFAVFSKTKLSLTLSSKFSEVQEDTPESDYLLKETKQMLVELMRTFRSCKTIHEMLDSDIGSETEREFLEAQAAGRQPARTSTASLLSRRKFGSLAAFRKAVVHNLEVLEERGVASSKDDYQDLLNSIAMDILQKRNHRLNRQRELGYLKTTQQKLDAKTRSYQETLDYYSQYVQACLSNLAGGKSRRQSMGGRRQSMASQRRSVGGEVATPDVEEGRALRSRNVLKYTGWKLHEKGILLEITGLDIAMLKNVSFEISPTNRTGIFSVRSRFLGMGADEITLDIQDLLRQQYEGTAVTNLFGRAKVNNNLLLYLLNKKFYGK
ncbi:unnamed protein product [Ixodes persulcatus]